MERDCTEGPKWYHNRLHSGIQIKVEGQPTQLSLNTTDKHTVIKGLKPYTSYCIRVRGYTKIGPSDWSPCTTVMTLQSGAV